VRDLLKPSLVARLTSLFILVAACGGGSTPPGGDDDDPPDCGTLRCTPPPPPGGPVQIFVRNNGLPAPGVAVSIVDFLGATTVTETDAQGLVEQHIELGATITVVNPFGPLPGGIDDVRTIVDAQPFDAFDVSNGNSGTVTMTVTGSASPGATSYELHTSCGTFPLTAPSGEVTIPRCQTIADAMLVALVGGVPNAAVTREFSLVEGGTIAFGSSYAAVPEQRVEYTGVGPFDEIAGTASLVSPRGELYERLFVADINANIGTGRVLLPRNPTMMTFVDSHLVPRNGDLTRHGALDWNPPSTGDRMFVDLFNQLLPTVITAPRFAATNLIVWDEAFRAEAVTLESSIPDAPGPTAQGPLINFELSVTRGEQRWNWSVISRYGGPSFNVPIIPGEHALVSGDTVEIERMFVAVTSGGYDLVRPTLLRRPQPADLVTTQLQTGRVTYQELR
jgi:hypothetical protein